MLRVLCAGNEFRNPAEHYVGLFPVGRMTAAGQHADFRFAHSRLDGFQLRHGAVAIVLTLDQQGGTRNGWQIAFNGPALESGIDP